MARCMTRLRQPPGRTVKAVSWVPQSLLAGSAATQRSFCVSHRHLVAAPQVLINTLGESKVTGENISKDLVVAEATSKSIDETRESYRSVATRGSLIYSVVASLGNLQHMYQLSLQFYKKLFNTTIERTQKSDDVEERIKLLIAAITLDSYVVICRGLFEADKLLYAFLMAVELEKYNGDITPISWDFFLRGSQQKPDGEPHPEWIPPVSWMEVWRGFV